MGFHLRRPAPQLATREIRHRSQVDVIMDSVCAKHRDRGFDQLVWGVATVETVEPARLRETLHVFGHAKQIEVAVLRAICLHTLEDELGEGESEVGYVDHAGVPRPCLAI